MPTANARGEFLQSSACYTSEEDARIRASFVAALDDADCPSLRNAFGCWLLERGFVGEAIEQFEKLRQLALTEDDSELASTAAHNLASARRSLKTAHVAAGHQQHSFALECHQVGQGRASSTIACDLAGLAQDAILAGNLGFAEKLIRHSLAMELMLGNTSDIATDWGILGIVLGLQGRLYESITCLRRAYQLHRESGDSLNAGRDLLNLGEFLSRRGRYRIAKRNLARAVAIFREEGAAAVLIERAETLLKNVQRMEGVPRREALRN